MSNPRNLYPDTTLYITVRAVHRSYRLVPKKRVNRVIQYAFAVVSSRYREEWGMEFYESEFLSSHYHLVLFDRFGKVTDFLMKRLRIRFLAEYRLALERFNAGERDVVFPAGTVRMRLRHKVLTEPVPLDLLLTA